jgi:hypothetical protein
VTAASIVIGAVPSQIPAMPAHRFRVGQMVAVPWSGAQGANPLGPVVALGAYTIRREQAARLRTLAPDKCRRSLAQSGSDQTMVTRRVTTSPEPVTSPMFGMMPPPRQGWSVCKAP